MSNSNYENRLRRLARRNGYVLRKSRARSINADDLGGWMLIDLARNRVVLGSRYDAEIEDVEVFLR